MNKTRELIRVTAALYLGYKAMRGMIVEYTLRNELEKVKLQKDIANGFVHLGARLIEIQQAEIEKLKSNSKEDQDE